MTPRQEVAQASLRGACPACGKRLQGIPKMFTATQVVRRTCRCGARWQVIVRPLPTRIEGVYADELTFVRPDEALVAPG